MTPVSAERGRPLRRSRRASGSKRLRAVTVVTTGSGLRDDGGAAAAGAAEDGDMSHEVAFYSRMAADEVTMASSRRPLSAKLS